jgi:hypothetical protein
MYYLILNICIIGNNAYGVKVRVVPPNEQQIFAALLVSKRYQSVGKYDKTFNKRINGYKTVTDEN